MTIRILLNTISKVKQFVEIIEKKDVKCYIISDTCKLDAGSMLSIFSLDITRPLELYIDTQNQQQFKDICTQIHQFAV